MDGAVQDTGGTKYSCEPYVYYLSCISIVCVQINFPRYWKTLKLSMFNNIVVGPSVLLLTWPMARWFGVSSSYELPTFSVAIFNLLFFLIIEEIWFYYFHRLVNYSFIHVLYLHNGWILGCYIILVCTNTSIRYITS